MANNIPMTTAKKTPKKRKKAEPYHPVRQTTSLVVFKGTYRESGGYASRRWQPTNEAFATREGSIVKFAVACQTVYVNLSSLEALEELFEQYEKLSLDLESKTLKQGAATLEVEAKVALNYNDLGPRNKMGNKCVVTKEKDHIRFDLDEYDSGYKLRMEYRVFQEMLALLSEETEVVVKKHK